MAFIRPVFTKLAARKLANQAARPFQDEWAGLVQDVLELEDQVAIEDEGSQQQEEADDGEGAEATADRAQIFDQLLLFEGVAVGGFADALEVILDTFQGGYLLLDLAAQLAMAVADLG